MKRKRSRDDSDDEFIILPSAPEVFSEKEETTGDSSIKKNFSSVKKKFKKLSQVFSKSVNK